MPMGVLHTIGRRIACEHTMANFCTVYISCVMEWLCWSIASRVTNSWGLTSAQLLATFMWLFIFSILRLVHFWNFWVSGGVQSEPDFAQAGCHSVTQPTVSKHFIKHYCCYYFYYFWQRCSEGAECLKNMSATAFLSGVSFLLPSHQHQSIDGNAALRYYRRCRACKVYLTRDACVCLWLLWYKQLLRVYYGLLV